MKHKLSRHRERGVRPLPKFVGREDQLKRLNDLFTKAFKGRGSLALVEGEMGIGKTRLLTEAERIGIKGELRVLWARCIGGATPLMPFLNAFENVSTEPNSTEATIEEVFYLHTDGRLIVHETQRQKPDLVDEELKGLLLEIQKTKKAGLRGLFLGDKRIIMESGAITVLAAVIRGEETPKMRQQMKYLIATLEDRFGEKFLEWSGKLTQLKGLRDSLKALLLGDYGKPEVLSLDFDISSPNIFDDITRFLISSSRERPMIILFDDIHWMDISSLDLLEYLGKRIEETRVVVVGSYRPEEVKREKRPGRKVRSVSDGIDALKRVPNMVKIEIGRLTRGEVGEMLASIYKGDRPGTQFEDFVYRHGEGNPFYTEEILRSLEESGKLWLDDDGWKVEDLSAMDIPVTIREAVLVRMAGLSKRTREVLQHAAIIGREWDTMVLIRTVKDPVDLDDALSELVGLNLISKVNDGRYRFDHDVVRETAYDDMSEAMRKLYHRKTGEALEDILGISKDPNEVEDFGDIPDENIFDLAEHFSLSKEKKKALRYNLRAGKISTEKHDYRSAASFLIKALEAARNLRRAEDMKRILWDLARIDEIRGDWDNALSYYDDLMRMLQVGEEEMQGKVLVKVATIHEWRNEWDKSSDNLERASELFDRIDKLSGRALVLLEKGRLLRRIGNYDSAMRNLEEALSLVEDQCIWNDMEEREQVHMKILKERAGIHYYQDDFEKAVKDYKATKEIAEALSDEPMIASILMNLGLTYVGKNDIKEGIINYKRSIEISKRIGNLRTLAYTYANLAEALIKENRMDDGAIYVRKALEIFYRIEDRLSIAHSHMIYGEIQTESGELEEAMVHFNMALEMALEIKETAILGQIYNHFARLYAKKGDPAMARKLYKKAISMCTDVGRKETAQRIRKELEDLESTRKGRLEGATVGRKRELIKLIGGYQKASIGDGQVLVIKGKTGTGKSKMIEQFLKVTRPHRNFTFISRSTPSEDPIPYGPFIEALEGVFHKEIPTETLTELRDIVTDNPQEMIKLFPSLASIPEISRLAIMPNNVQLHLSSIQKEKDRLFENITRLILAFTITSPVILVLDDFQWADPSSIGLLHYLSRKSTKSRLYILMAYSPEDLASEGKTHPLIDALRLMNRERLTTVLELGNMNEAETKEMIHLILDNVSVPDVVVDTVFKETEGNPFFVEEVVLSLLEQGIIDPMDAEDPLKKDISSIKLPKTMSQVVERRLKSLDEDERSTLRLAGMIGIKFGFDTLQALSGLGEDRLVGILDSLMGKGLIIEDEKVDDLFRFALEHIRRIVTEGMPPSESMKLHDQIAMILEHKERSEEYAFELAHHHKAAGNLLAAAKWSYISGLRAMRFAAIEEAGHHMKMALDLLDELPKSKEVLQIRGEVQYLYGDICYKTGNYEVASQHFLYLLETAKDLNDENLLAHAYLGIGRVRSGRGAFPQAKESWIKALDIFERLGDIRNLIFTKRSVSTILWRENNFEEALGELLACNDLAENLGEPAILGAIQSALGNVYRDMGEWDKSIDHFKKGIELLENTSDRHELATAYNNLGATYRYMEQWDRSIDYLQRAIDLCRKINYPSILGYGLKNLGEVLAKRGRPEDLDLADMACDEAMVIFQSLSHLPGTANVHMNKGIIERFRKDWDNSKREFEEAIRIGKRSKVPDLLADIYFEYAISLLESGKPIDARRNMGLALKIFDDIGALGRLDRAKEFMDRTKDILGGDPQ